MLVPKLFDWEAYQSFIYIVGSWSVTRAANLSVLLLDAALQGVVHLAKHSPPCLLAFASFYAFSSTQHPLVKSSNLTAKKAHLTANAKCFFEGLGSHRQDHKLLAFVIFPTKHIPFEGVPDCQRLEKTAARLACQTITSMAATVDDIEGWNWHHLRKITRCLLFEFLWQFFCARSWMAEKWVLMLSFQNL